MYIEMNSSKWYIFGLKIGQSQELFYWHFNLILMVAFSFFFYEIDVIFSIRAIVCIIYGTKYLVTCGGVSFGKYLGSSDMDSCAIM